MANSKDKYSFVRSFKDIDKTQLELVGGKGANLGELSRLEDICIPEGFCVSTKVFKRIIEDIPSLNELLHQLSILHVNDRKEIGKRSAFIRTIIEETTIPPYITEQISTMLSVLGEHNAYAVRSSATAEDLPTASFAGQQDTFLNVIGKESILRHIRKCWASLFTERAIIYRMQNGYDHCKVQLAVVVQKMVFPHAAGILFTADPFTSNRKIISIDASFGLGEALVSGLVNADNYKVRNNKIIDKKIFSKKLTINALPGGGTKEEKVAPDQQNRQVLTDDQIIALACIGKRIEAHFGQPQDIEWCLVDETFYIVQTRPITTLYPVPEINDEEVHVYVSVGHQQMMTDAMKPLGLSFFLLMTNATMRKAGSRLFVDITPMLASAAGRETLMNVLGKSDPLFKDALMTIIERKDLVKPLPSNEQEQPSGKAGKSPSLTDYSTLKDYDPAIVDELINQSKAAMAALKQNIQTKAGPELFDFILEAIQQAKKTSSDSQSFGVIMTAMNAASWVNEKMQEWLGEKSVADTLSQSVPYNITSEMGLALLDVADAIRPYPEVIQYLQNIADDNFLEALNRYEGGQQTLEAITAFLHRYGMRCAGEIDITRPRWREKPATLIPIILMNIKNMAPGASKQRFEEGQERALAKEKELLDRLKALPDGEKKAAETKRMIGLIRNFAGYREYPKYSIVSRYFIYKQAILKEAEQLVQDGAIHNKEDIYYLTFEELREVVQTRKLVYELISRRKEEYKIYERLTPPRIITSEGEIIAGKYNREHLPAKAIAGLPVSSGTTEGRARIILTLEDASLEDGDILVTTFTDPSWTPLFVSIKGLVTEVGGLMTHGAVIAREYGLPAVVGVENATRLIKDGQHIRVNGTEGYIEIL